MTNGHCRSCNALVLFARAKSGKMVILDASASPGGTYAIHRTNEWTADFVPAAERQGRNDLHMDHHATCPRAADWRHEPKKETALPGPASSLPA